MAKIADEMLRDIEKDTVDWDPNFDESRKEPRVLPVPLPQPAGQRLLGHRRGHGHQHPAPQPPGGDRRVHLRAGQPGGRPQRPDAAHQGPRLPHKGASSWAAPASGRPTPPAGAGSSSVPGTEFEEFGQRTAPASSSPSCPIRSTSAMLIADHRRAGARTRSWRASPTCGTSPTATACASSSSSSRTPTPRWCSTACSPRPSCRPPSPSTCWPWCTTRPSPGDPLPAAHSGRVPGLPGGGHHPPHPL